MRATFSYFATFTFYLCDNIIFNNACIRVNGVQHRNRNSNDIVDNGSDSNLFLVHFYSSQFIYRTHTRISIYIYIFGFSARQRYTKTFINVSSLKTKTIFEKIIYVYQILCRKSTTKAASEGTSGVRHAYCFVSMTTCNNMR